MKLLINKELANNLRWADPKIDVEGYIKIEDNWIEDRRWVQARELIIRDSEMKYWRSCYEIGLTEYQDTEPWEDSDKAEFRQVVQRAVVTFVYEDLYE
jgi:hypothetical protein